jgi:hypothetical protein
VIDSAPDHSPRFSFGPLLWALFLGASWTWIIGMFLPVLLVRDYGLWGWVVFAVPNVVGAAAMGWALRDARASAAFVRRHAGACYAFSLVTIAYHVFFAMWMIQRLRGLGFVALAAFVVATLVVRGNLTRWGAAAVAMITSFVLWRLLLVQGEFLTLPASDAGRLGGAGGALLLLPPFILGFGLCPYLDLTFHRARQLTSRTGGQLAFGVGFGAVFCSMIVFTLLYARWLAPAVDGISLSTVSTTFLCVHLIVQSAVTVAFHVRELPTRSAFPDRSVARTLIGTSLVVLVGAAVLGFLASPHRTVRGHDFGEVIYLCFLGFYGLVFPGYLWIHGFPGKSIGILPAARTMRVLLVMIALAFPAYWMGFVEGKPVWLLPGAVILLISRALMPRTDRPPLRGHPDGATATEGSRSRSSG